MKFLVSRFQKGLRRLPHDVHTLWLSLINRGWEVWTKVVARRDIEERLMRPWNGRGGSA